VENRILLFDQKTRFSLLDLEKSLSTESFYYPVYQTNDLTDLILNLIKALHTNNEVCLVDPHFTLEEVKNCGLEVSLNKKVEIDFNFQKAEIILSNLPLALSEITIFTSGTTGIPKKITHHANKLLKTLKTTDEMSSKVWGMTYNPTHMAGLQVIFQALCSRSTLVNLYLFKEKEKIFKAIEDYGINMISATPTFYRMLMPTNYTNDNVKQVTLGGERSDLHLINRLKQIFKNARVRNIYATTESGSLFSAENDIFTVSSDKSNDIKIVNKELFLKAYLLGYSTDIELQDSWYKTGDVVEVISENPLQFRFVSRISSIINVGGNKVDPFEVEEAIREIPGIKESRVFAKKNSVTGNLVCCDIIIDGSTELNEKHIIQFLQDKIANYKIPRIIKFVESIEVTRTGKIKRN